MALDHLPEEVIQNIFSFLPDEPHWSNDKSSEQRDMPLKSVSLTTLSLRQSIFRILFRWSRIRVEVTDKNARPSRMPCMKDFKAFIEMNGLQDTIHGLTVQIILPDIVAKQLPLARKLGFSESDALLGALFEYIGKFSNPQVFTVFCLSKPRTPSTVQTGVSITSPAVDRTYQNALCLSQSLDSSVKIPSHLLLLKRRWHSMSLSEEPCVPSPTAHSMFCARTPSLLQHTEHKALVSIARRLKHLKFFSYTTSSPPRCKCLGHIFTFLNSLPHLKVLRVQLIPANITDQSEDYIEDVCPRLLQLYLKFAAIIRAKGTGQKLRHFLTPDYERSLPFNLDNILSQKLVGWDYKGQGYWTLVPPM